MKVTVDGIEVEVPPGSNVLQACEAAGKEVPRFCYHERLSVAGNCRMCLVEIEKAPPKPFASCAYPAADGMVVHTDSPMVRAARRAVMEFLLINHPLDCPICDQGGECDLQDQAVGYGMDHSRYDENKRAVRDKDLGPLVKTVMTRCIHCTRCIRFSTEIAGVSELGATGRGENMEVGTYVEKALSSELSGNLIDICPVGALTSKPYAFVARPWELTKTDSVDVMDAVGAAIRVDTRGPEVLRILPRLNEDVNEEWLADKSRFALDGLRRRRLDHPWVRRGDKLIKASWTEAFDAIKTRLSGMDGSKIGAIAGDLCDVESMVALRDLMAALGSPNLDCRQDGAALDASRRDFYTFNTTIAGIEEADAVLMIGTNPRIEAPLINARLRKRWLQNQMPVALIGEPADLTYKVEMLENRTATLAAIAAGTHPFAAVLKAAKRPMLILGQAALARADGAAVLAQAWSLAAAYGMLSPEWHGFNVLHSAAARVGGMDIGFLPGASGSSVAEMLAGSVEALWLLGADEADLSKLPSTTFVIYQGHHGDRGAGRADVILPGCAYTEKDGTWVNTEGRVQRGQRAGDPPGQARDDWAILRAVSAALGKPLPYDSLAALRKSMEAKHPMLRDIDSLPRFGCADTTGPAANGQLSEMPFGVSISNYYMTDPISRASATMAACTEALSGHAMAAE
ncbi:MAG: NADH-quinone oxidoreductase subunit G [Alphaproteobacteria bacterium]|nr:NADH-quinone oxidoreductase subunit G [Alphaproteobacteria bacterium]